MPIGRKKKSQNLGSQSLTAGGRVVPAYTQQSVDEAPSSATTDKQSRNVSRFRHQSATGPLYVTTAPTRQPRFHRLDVWKAMTQPDALQCSDCSQHAGK